MTYTLFDYDHSVVQQHVDELRRDADRARLARSARRSRRQRRQQVATRSALRPAQAR
jgi:hypothetical protein